MAAFFAFHHFFFALRIFSIASADIVRLRAVAVCSRFRRALCALRIFAMAAALNVLPLRRPVARLLPPVPETDSRAAIA